MRNNKNVPGFSVCVCRKVIQETTLILLKNVITSIYIFFFYKQNILVSNFNSIWNDICKLFSRQNTKKQRLKKSFFFFSDFLHFKSLLHAFWHVIYYSLIRQAVFFTFNIVYRKKKRKIKQRKSDISFPSSQGVFLKYWTDILHLTYLLSWWHIVISNPCLKIT